MVHSKSISLFLSLACFGLTPTQVRAAEPDLAGHYRAEGTSPEGTDYTQHVHIVKKGDTYYVRWTSPDDKDYLTEGVGVLKDDMLAVAWHGSSQGVVLYAIEKGEKGPRLVGRWTHIDTDGKVGHETLHHE